MTAEETKVQTVTTVIIKFKTAHILDDPGSLVEIKMPGNFTLPPLDTVMTVKRITEKK